MRELTIVPDKYLLSDAARRFTVGGAFAALTTMRPNGMPSTQMMWVDADDEHVLINTETHRLKFRDMQQDPRVAVMIFRPEDPHSYVEVRGVVDSVETGQNARDHIDLLSMRYHDVPYQATIVSERVIVRIRPVHKVIERGTIDR